MLDWTSNTSASTASYTFAQTWLASETRMSCGVTRTRLGPWGGFSQRTVPSRMYAAPSSWPICGIVFVVFLYCTALVGPMTLGPCSAVDRAVPSAVVQIDL